MVPLSDLCGHDLHLSHGYLFNIPISHFPRCFRHSTSRTFSPSYVSPSFPPLHVHSCGSRFSFTSLEARSPLHVNLPRPALRQGSFVPTNPARSGSKTTPVRTLCSLVHSANPRPDDRNTRSAGPQANTARYTPRHTPHPQRKHTRALPLGGTSRPGTSPAPPPAAQCRCRGSGPPRPRASCTPAAAGGPGRAVLPCGGGARLRLRVVRPWDWAGGRGGGRRLGCGGHAGKSGDGLG